MENEFITDLGLYTELDIKYFREIVSSLEDSFERGIIEKFKKEFDLT